MPEIRSKRVNGKYIFFLENISNFKIIFAIKKTLCYITGILCISMFETSTENGN